MIRRALEKDAPKICDLLAQVNEVHYKGRPDIFKLGLKYSVEEVKDILKKEDSPVFVYVDQNDEVLGYVFCLLVKQTNLSLFTDVTTLYIDDLCVDNAHQRKGIGKRLFEFAVNFAKEKGCYNLTLNVWSCNPTALKFYEALGLSPQKTYLEKIL